MHEKYPKTIKFVYPQGARELFIFGAIFSPFGADFDAFQWKLHQIQYDFRSFYERNVLYITVGMLYYNVYPLKLNEILPNKKLGQKSLKIAVFGDFTKNFKEISNYFHKNPFRFTSNSKFHFFRWLLFTMEYIQDFLLNLKKIQNE